MNKKYAFYFICLVGLGSSLAQAQPFLPQQNNGISLNGIYKLMKQQANKPHKTVYGKKALLNAAQAGDYSKVDTLLKLGKNPAILNSEKQNPLMAAIENKHLYVAQRIVEDPQTGLQVLNQQDSRAKSSPLMYAIMFKMPEIVEPLLRAGANPNLQNNMGQTPLALALLAQNNEIFITLKTYSANSTLKDIYGNTLLMLATYQGEDRALWLLEHDKKQDLTARNQQGLSALDMAVKYNYLKLIETLAANPAVQKHLNDTDDIGNTPLITALWNNQPDAALILYKYGANPLIQNVNGQTALSSATSYPEVLRIFLQDPMVRQAATELKDNYGQPAASAYVSKEAQKVFEEFGIELVK